MEYHTELVHLHCPYCGERIELVVDLSIDHQEYVEDCPVCCRPISMVVAVTNSGADVRARREDD